MDEIRQNGTFVRKAMMVAFVLAIVVSPFFYHLISFLLIPIIIPLVAIFAFVYYTGLTDFEQSRMIKFNIAFAIGVIALYEAYVLFVLTSGASHIDIHLNIAIWLVQILAVNFLIILYKSLKAYKKRKAIEMHEDHIKEEELRRNA